MSRSPLRYSASTGGFYHTGVHGAAVPADAVALSTKRHAELLAAQGSRAIVPGEHGAPALTAVRRPIRADLLARAIVAIKKEASRRILAIASLERQMNDNAALAIAALGGDTNEEAQSARKRRLQIDRVRSASNTIETSIAAWSAAALAKFDASADMRWPTGV